MKSVLLGLTSLLAFQAHAVEYAVQVENERVLVAKVKIMGHEELPAHRDAYPQVVVALKGGTITRLEADGNKTDVSFPTGIAVFREPDPENELHKSFNPSSEPVELIIVQLKK